MKKLAAYDPNNPHGKNDTEAFTGIGTPDPQQPGVEEPYNPYRFNHKRFDAASGAYDMGFRTYDPGMSRFTSRDLYLGARANMGLTVDGFTGNRYAFTAGNPISRIELDGHGFCNARGVCESPSDPRQQGTSALLAESPNHYQAGTEVTQTSTPSAPASPAPSTTQMPEPAGPTSYDEFKEVQQSGEISCGDDIIIALGCVTYWWYAEDGVDCASDASVGACAASARQPAEKLLLESGVL